MISKEDYRNGKNLSEEQLAYRDQYAREGAQNIRAGRTRRRLMSIALLPYAAAQARGRFINSMRNIEPMGMFMSSDDVAIVTMTDHPARNGNSYHFVETRAIAGRAFMDSGSTVCVGGLKDACILRSDFSRGPLTRGQRALKCCEDKELCSPRDGRLSVARSGKWIDVCVGRSSSGGAYVVVYRLLDDLFYGDEPEVEPLFDLPKLPASGEMLDIADVQIGEPLLKPRRKIEYFRAMLDEKLDPKMDWPPSRIFPADRAVLFRTLNLMLTEQNNATLLEPGAARTSLADPTTWAFKPFVAFVNGARRIGDGPLIDVDATDIMSLPGFTITKALQDDFCTAIGPNGNLFLTASHAGVVSAITEVPDQHHLIRIAYEDGAEQFVPSTAILYLSDKDGTHPLKIGDEVTEGSKIGDLCARVRFSNWETVAATFGDNLNWAVSEFLWTTAISYGEYGWDSSETLYDLRYVTSVLDYAACTPKLEVRWYWDLRDAMQYYNAELNAIVLPPIRYNDWNDFTPVINGVAYDLCDPFFVNREELQAAASDGTPVTSQLEEVPA